ncbi:MAG: hypothetical protein ACRDJV_03830 [Actinomycetota bacterium]
MPDAGSLLVAALTIMTVGVLLWFAFGTQNNIKRGNLLLAWIQTGLPAIGQRTKLKWLGTSVVQLDISEPTRPFREAQVMIVLEPRDIGLLWMVSRRRGRRDFIIVRTRLQSSPQFEFEAGDVRRWTGSDRLSRLDADAWQRSAWRDGAVQIAHTPRAKVDDMRALWDELESLTGGVWRLSVRRDSPHLEAHFAPPADRASAADVFAALKRIANTAMAKR